MTAFKSLQKSSVCHNSVPVISMLVVCFHWLPFYHLHMLHMYVSATADQTSLQENVEICDLGEAPASEVLIAAEEQMEQDVLKPQDIHTPVYSSKDDKAKELDKDQTSLHQNIEICDLGEAPVSEVLPTFEKEQEQPQDVSIEDDEAEEPDNSTEMFCPPEFSVNGRYHAKPATVWSLGMLLFVMVCGYYPDDEDLHRISKNDWSKTDLSQECCLSRSGELAWRRCSSITGLWL
ncbi:serine threonine- kinase pim-1-like protein [Labeo rohita]|uniref:non-specific serine/threonine protein kinase n=1 Tax=Labeo rohita TaxID=84645 RepID=A0A498NKE1_LABRO|nr:serine threonine- kinase pim-1-like protein [Labeo rohita]